MPFPYTFPFPFDVTRILRLVMKSKRGLVMKARHVVPCQLRDRCVSKFKMADDFENGLSLRARYVRKHRLKSTLTGGG